MSRFAHPAGEMHAQAAAPAAIGPEWLRVPDDVNALLRRLWPASVDRSRSGALTLAGVDVRDLAERYGTPVYVLDEADFRARARAFRDAFAPDAEPAWSTAICMPSAGGSGVACSTRLSSARTR